MIALVLTLLLTMPQDPPTQDPPPGGATPPATATAVPAAVPRDDAAVARLQGCAMEGERWVCRYQMPEIRVVETAPTSLTVAPADPSAGGPVDVGVLTDAERALVTRCADAGWMSLCLPGDRRQARALRDASVAYEAKRRDVTALLAQGRCDAAVTTALEAGHLNLAREARAFCGR